MKKLVLLVAILLGFGYARTSLAAEDCSKTDSRKSGAVPVCTALDAVVTTGVSATVDTFGYRYVNAQIWADVDDSVSTVLIECRSRENAPWYTCYSKSNVGNSTGHNVYVTLPRSYQYRANVSAWTSGAISFTFERYNY